MSEHDDDQDLADAQAIYDAEAGPRRRRQGPDPRERIPAEVVIQLIAGDPPLRVWRRHRKLSPASLAAAIGMEDSQRLRDIEAGLEPPTEKFLETAARMLRIDPDDLRPWDIDEWDDPAPSSIDDPAGYDAADDPP